MMDVLNERQNTVAMMLARGYSQRYINRTTTISRDTIRRWERDPFFASEVDRIREQVRGSTATGVIIDALVATDPSGAADWDVRLKAAFKLVDLERTPRDDILGSDDETVGWQPI